METFTKSPLKTLLLAFLLIASAVVVMFSPEKALAATKTYGYSNPSKDYMYNQAANWWGVGDGSSSNGSAVNAFAAAMSVLYGRKITPAAVAKVTYEKNYWNLSSATPSNLIHNLTVDSTFNGKILTEAAGSSTSVRLAALAKVFTKTDGVVIARATGSKPFKTSESGGHYILILAYRSNGNCLVYDPAQASASPKWGSAKTLFNQMKSNIMFYAISKGQGTSASSDTYFEPAKEGLADQTPDDGEGESTPEEDPFNFETEDQNLDCDENPFQAACESEDSIGEPAPVQEGTGEAAGGQISTTTYAQTLTEKAITAAWPVINGSSATCYDSKGKSYNWVTYGSDYHNQSTCGRNVRSEYLSMLNSLGVSYDTSEYTYESWRERAETFFSALFKAAGIKTNLYSYLSSHSLTEYFDGNLTDLSESINNVNRLAYGDIIVSGGSFYIYTGDKTGNYGNVITSKIDVEGPHVERYSGDLTDSSTKIYRLKEDSFYKSGDSRGESSGEFEIAAPSLEDEIPESEQTEAEQGVASVTPSETIAARAMSFAWPYTKYSTDDSTLWGKCVKKYNGAKTTYSTFPKTQKKFKLSTYPTGTGCNKVLPAAYANFKGITGNSAMNSANVTALGFVKNVYKSLGVSVPYNNISDLKNKLGSTATWELITNNATKETDFQPGDLLVSKDSVAIYVGDYGDGYGTIVQAYYKKWTPRVTPLYLNKTYVFRLKSSATVSEDGASCPELDSASASGNDKIAIEAVKMSWPNTTGDSTSLGKCETTKGSYTDFPEAYSYSYANVTFKTSLKSASTLTKARKKTTCSSTYTTAFDTAAKKYLSTFNTAASFTYAVMRTAGVNWFEPSTKASDLNIPDIFAHLKADTEHFTLVSKKLTSTKGLQPGDIIINSETKSKKTYSDMLIYVGTDYGSDCTGKIYGNVVKADTSETPHLQPIYYRINNSSSRSYFWVFRAKENAYSTYEQTPEPEEPKTCEEDPTQSGCEEASLPEATNWGEKIAIQAIKFSWPYTKYSLEELGITGTNYANAMGKCVNTSNKLSAWPTPFKGNGYDARDAAYSGAGCDKMAAPLYARYRSFNDKRSYSTLVSSTGIYTDDIRNNYKNKVYNGSGWDCISFVNNVLKKAGAVTFPSSTKSSINYKKTGWMKIGDYIQDTSSARTAYKNNKVLKTNQGIELKPGDVVVRYDVCFDKNSCGSGTTTITYPADKDHPLGYTHYVLGGHIFIYTGNLGFPYGDRAEASNGDYVGGTLRDTWISDHIYNYGRAQVYRYVGTNMPESWN